MVLLSPLDTTEGYQWGPETGMCGPACGPPARSGKSWGPGTGEALEL